MGLPPAICYEDEIYGVHHEIETTVSLALFRLNQEWYGVDVHHVLEVITVLPITFLPKVPEHILGIINVRGEIYPLIDIKRALGLPAPVNPEENRIILLETKGVAVGILVDEAATTLNFPLSKIEEPIFGLKSEWGDGLKGQIYWEDRLIGLLDVGKLIERTRL